MVSLEKVMSAARNTATASSYIIDEIMFHDGYAEPGYSADQIAVGNWNSVTVWDKKQDKFIVVDDTPKRLGDILEKMGFTLEWNDEWASCECCNKLIRTQGDSYSWQPSYVIIDDCSIHCRDCVDPAEHLSSLEGKTKKANTISDIDPSEYGYVQIAEFENGWYGIADSPEKIAKHLKEKGIYRFLFSIDGNEQFRTLFSVYVHEDEYTEELNKLFSK